jgi:hypothetical protein
MIFHSNDSPSDGAKRSFGLVKSMESTSHYRSPAAGSLVRGLASDLKLFV